MATICVFCASSERIDPAYVDLAGELGTAMVERGHDLVSGGGRVSAMGAVARAVRAGGGHTVGVIPAALRDLEVADEEADELVVVADMRARKGEMDRRCDAFLALPGGLGTLEELLEIWVSRSLNMHRKPVVVLDVDGVYSSLRQQVETLVERQFVRPDARDVVVWASTIAAALDVIEEALATAQPAGAGVTAEELLEAEP